VDVPPRLELRPSDRAAIVYTSGSTGQPKGATLRHANLVANTRSIVQYLGLASDDRVMVVLPFHYVYGKSLLNTHIAVGGSVVIENGFLFPQRALETLERTCCTGFSGVPSTFAILLNRSNLACRTLPHLRYVTQAGGAMAPELQRRLIAALPGKQIFVMYGATEASARLAYLPPHELPRKLGSIGKAIPGVALRVLREDNTEAGVGEVGELVAQGENIMEGYWDDPDETGRVLDQFGYHTGDLARRDEEGFLYVVGRSREMIKSGAHRIAPKEIEEVLQEHPAVHEAAVVGVPDEILGEAIAAYVSPRAAAPLCEQALLQWCRAKLPSHKVPGLLRVVEDFERNAAGKINKLVLGSHASGDRQK
jgi:acyl-CoA synthetase (AMP-forming)/AMP-acid ligase II